MKTTVPGPFERIARSCAATEATARSISASERLFLTKIAAQGGQQRADGAQGALEVFYSALAQLVRENPQAYGAESCPESQRLVVSRLFESVSHSFLTRTAAEIRHHAGFVLVCGYWIHRAVFTFVAFGLLAALALPLCATSLLSSTAWGWMPGTIGLGASIALGIWVLTRIRPH